jgi:hypothetical protein
MTVLPLRTGLALLEGLALAVSAASPATAAAPVTFPTEEHAAGTVDCGTVQDNFVDDMYGQGFLYLDAAGNPARDPRRGDVGKVRGLVRSAARPPTGLWPLYLRK